MTSYGMYLTNNLTRGLAFKIAIRYELMNYPYPPVWQQFTPLFIHLLSPHTSQNINTICCVLFATVKLPVIVDSCDTYIHIPIIISRASGNHVSVPVKIGVNFCYLITIKYDTAQTKFLPSNYNGHEFTCIFYKSDACPIRNNAPIISVKVHLMVTKHNWICCFQHIIHNKAFVHMLDYNYGPRKGDFRCYIN